jgi:hypothetical protein
VRKLVVLAVLAGLLVVADIAARAFAEGKIASRMESATRGEADADADIDSFPFLGRLLATGSAGDVHIRMTNVPAQRIAYSALEIDLSGVKVDRDLLLQREVEVTDIDEGTLAVELTAPALSRALGIPVEIRAGAVEVTVQGRKVPARASITGGDALQLTVDPLPGQRIPIPRSPLVPCVSRAEVRGDRVRISCTFEEVPEPLVRAATPGARGGARPAGPVNP